MSPAVVVGHVDLKEHFRVKPLILAVVLLGIAVLALVDFELLFADAEIAAFAVGAVPFGAVLAFGVEVVVAIFQVAAPDRGASTPLERPPAFGNPMITGDLVAEGHVDQLLGLVADAEIGKARAG